jgi:DNA-binding NarL/FixJ family response regulator
MIFMSKIRILLADDHETFLEGVSLLLEKDFEIVGRATNGLLAVEEAERLDPDVLVIDISMPVLNGLQVVARLQKRKCRTRIVVLTVHEDQAFVAAALSSGASGYVTKGNVTTDLIPAIHEALRGGTYITQSIPS